MRACCALLLLVSLPLTAAERILSFESDILVRTDGSIEVTETIRVRAEGRQIRRGIYRDFPTDYRDRLGNRVTVNYSPRSVLRNGLVEEFRSERVSNGLRTYFGSASVVLDPGEYTYTYRYNADRMLGYFDDHDELYWNVTGQGWNFPIDRASASLRFAFAVDEDDIAADAWAGASGSNDRKPMVSVADGRVHVATRAPLAARNGMTVVASWPKGLLAEPDRWQRLAWLASDNRDFLAALAGLLLILVYYVPVWLNFGRDPAPGVTFTRYEPPVGFSPASLRYIRKMGYDSKVFTAAVVNLAVQGRLRIVQQDDTYWLHRAAGPANAGALANGEQELLSELFRDGDSIELDAANHATMTAARSAHTRSLRRDYRNRFFRVNGMMNLPAFLLFILTLVVVFAAGEAPGGAAWLTLGVLVVTIAVFVWLMKQPTGIGRRVLDETAGFRDYLEIAEKDELALRNPPEKTPALFEKFLPYALALGVEQAWSERFAGVLAGLHGENAAAYRPLWFSGDWNDRQFARKASSLGSRLDSAISSSMTAPGSTSGSGGGGVAGGGGGGGGGGGW